MTAPSICSFQVFSSMASEVGYDADTSELFVKWTSGKMSVYSGVPPEVAREAATSFSVGQFLNSAVKGKYPHVEFIVMTGYGTVKTAVEAMQRGVTRSERQKKACR